MKFTLLLSFLSFTALASERSRVVNCHSGAHTVEIFQTELTRNMNEFEDGYFDIEVKVDDKMLYQESKVIYALDKMEYSSTKLILSNPYRSQGENSYLYLKGMFNTLKLICE